MTTHTITADELLRMPEDGVRRELVAGEIREMTPVGRRHAHVSQNLNRSLDAHVRAHALGEVFAEFGYILVADPATVRAPDLSFVRAERLAAVPGEGYFPGAPDLAIEVVSPGDRAGDVRTKASEYLAAGTRMVLVADPQRRTVAIHRPGHPVVELLEDGVTDGGDVVPGWRMEVRDVLA